MAARRTGLDLPLPLLFLAAWLAVWLGRVLQEQVDYLKAEFGRMNALARPKPTSRSDEFGPGGGRGEDLADALGMHGQCVR